MSRAPSIPNTSQVDRYHEFVAGLRKTPPVETEFEVGQRVAYVNDYGVIFEDHTIMGFADDDSFYGKFIHLNTDCYWCSVAPYSLRTYDEDGEFEIREGEVVYERPAI
jgi:hypothetical protein